ncbi:MAG TPA: chromosome segregation protein SMC [Clostridia bacterium]|jgi:chromosome segregation protein|nr:chromosome segregation protein SMC [Clostridiaceae bacterium]HOF26921.1 chromosome segregation protein SMC [Clostridia bacterium]HOM34575.1 chromosome segregation protein SMC [Clostridia bacterium]HOT70212.1 chromosome segregation protein SMC [Clostridia bacterium]HQG00083.1 chromosome segregation protein SMC [Clostridia bacterium]
MILKKVELQGFKSFATRTVLEFNKGITAIVGPNGSGKSNIADAIRWVLGSQSSKQLRGGNMSDMIFSGTQYRRPVGFAEVSLYFDNSDKHLAVDFEDVKITRRLYRSGESDYSVNDKSCRLKDIQMMFFDTGVGKEGYSIIGQNEIKDIVDSNSLERRGIFEEAAGIMKYKQKKLEALRKLSNTEENLVRITDIISEIENQLEPLRLQAEKAKEYLRVYEILKVNEVGLYLNNLQMYQKRIQKYEQDIQVLSEDILTRESELENIKQENRDSINIINRYEEQEQNLKDELNTFLRDLESQRHEIILCNERLSNADSELIKNGKEIEEYQLRENELSKDYLTKEDRRKYLENQYTSYKEKLDLLTAQAESITASLSGSEKILEGVKASLMRHIEETSDSKLVLNNVINEKNALKTQLDMMDNDINKKVLENDSILLAKQDNQSKNIAAKKQQEQLASRRDKSKTEYALLQKRMEQAESAERNLKTNIEILQSNYKLIYDMEKQMHGYKQDVKAVLENKSLNGIVDVVAKLMGTEEIYNTAIEAALGGNIQNVVVEDEEAAKAAIAFLKENKLGRVTFLPVSSVRPNQFNKDEEREILSYKGVIDVAYKLLEYDSKYENIAKNLLGRILVVDTYDNAVLIARKTQSRYKLVTLTGEFFNTGGSITGGTQNVGKVGLLGRHKQLDRLESEIAAHKEKLEQSVTQSRSMSKQASELASDIDKTEQCIIEGNMLTAKLESAISALDEAYKSNTDALNATKNRKKELTDKYHGYDDKIAILNNQIDALSEQIEKDKLKINEYEEGHKEQSAKRDNIYLDISDMKVSVNSIEESLKNNDESLIRIGFEKQALTVKRNELIKRNEQLKEIKADLQDKIQTKSKNISNPEKVEKEKNKAIQELQNKRKKLSQENEKYIQNITDVNRDIMLLSNKISSIEVNKAKTDAEMTAMKERMWDEYNLTHNEALQRHGEIENITEARKEIAEARNIIKQLGPVNIHSIEDYAKTNERYRFFTTQKEDIEKSKEDLYKTVNEMNTVMRKIFKEKFEIINDNFNEIFARLFEGGQAKLELTDQSDILECGIDIIAQPPGKKLQNMMLLSGGEKAFTAIALVFAMLKLNPSPFCVFDEIDTSLDDNNVLKYCKYLNEHKSNTQFVLITHRKGTMENADTIYGVTMQEHGITKVVSMKITE